MKNFICASICLFFISIIIQAQPGTLDESFGDKGIVINKAFYGDCYTIAIQSDGKIVTGGYYYDEALKESAAVIARFNSDGSLDKNFGDNGEVLIYKAEGKNAVGPTSIAIQTDGKIVICTRFMDVAEGDVGLIRLNTDGSLDNSFDKDGIAIKSVGKNDLIGEMMLQPDGKILVTGMKGVKESGISPAYALRYLTNGKLDDSFGEKGVVVLPSTIVVRSITALATQDDGKILLAGYDFSRNYIVIRLIIDGTLDNTFNEDGIASLIIENVDRFSSDLEDITVQRDGKILACGSAGSSGDRMTLARFNNDGSVDLTFGEKTGYSILYMPSGLSKAYNVYSNIDNSVTLTGYYNTGLSTEDFGVVKYNNEGIIDSSFGIHGIATASVDLDSYDIGYSSLIQPDGKVVMGGSVDAENKDEKNIALLRFNNDATLPIIYSKFTATQTKEYITLNWQTTTELNNSYFAVERSSNAANYTSVVQVKSMATGAAVQDYAYTDKLPLAGTNYYRLKQVDKDGKFSYSKTVSIGYLKPGSIQLFPNPAKDKLTVKRLNAAITSTIAVFDIQGKQLLQFTAKDVSYSFSIGSLAPGTYMVRVKDANGTAVEKFVKQ